MEALHEHNQRTYENICRMYDEGIQRVAVVQPTGSGKSLLMAKLIEDNPNSRFFVLSTSHKINEQFKAKLDEKMLERVDCNIYCNMPNMKQETMEALQPDCVFLDEMHRALAKEWSKGIMRLLEMYPNAKVLGLSATPIRYLDRCRNVVEELFGGNLACDMSLSEAILDGILPMARYVCGVYSYEKDTESLNKKIEKSCNSDEEKKELLKELKVLKENLDKGHGVSDIFRKYIVSGSEKFVVFLKDTTHLRDMKPVIEKWFTDAGFTVRIYEVHSKNIDKNKEFQAFKEDTEDGIIKACLSVNMIAEGIHGDIDGVIMLRETISPNMYFQMIGRAFACGKKTIPLIFDLVANSQFISDAADNFPNEIKREIERRKEECKKEGKDYKVGFDVDEFIVMDEFMDVVSGFREIEGRLEGDWDAMFQEYCKFYKENGHGDVPKTERYMKLYNWCAQNRINKIQDSISGNRISLLDENNFIWELKKYRFIKRLKEIAQYYEAHGKYPSLETSDSNEKQLAAFLANQKYYMKKQEYPQWKTELFKKYCSSYVYMRSKNKAFNKFIFYANLYKEENGHLNIKYNDIINRYNIGCAFNNIKTLYRNNKLSISEVEKLETLGISLENKFDVSYLKKFYLAKNAVEEGIVIDYKNRIYKNVDLFSWVSKVVRIKYNNYKMSNDEMDIISKLLGKSIHKFFNKGSFIKVIDVTDNKNIAIYKSQREAANKINEIFNIKINDKNIWQHLNCKITAPYKGRFMFYYATDEEVKKYLEDGKQANS